MGERSLGRSNCFQGIRISRLGFPNRMLYQEFLKRYYLLNSQVSKTSPDPKGATEKILAKLISDGVVDKDRVRFGLTKIFFRTGEMAKVEETREKIVGDMIGEIQAAARGYVYRKIYIRMQAKKKAAVMIASAIRAWLELRTDSWYKLCVLLRSESVKLWLRREQIEAALKQRLGKLNVDLERTTGNIATFFRANF